MFVSLTLNHMVPVGLLSVLCLVHSGMGVLALGLEHLLVSLEDQGRIIIVL